MYYARPTHHDKYDHITWIRNMLKQLKVIVITLLSIVLVLVLRSDSTRFSFCLCKWSVPFLPDSPLREQVVQVVVSLVQHQIIEVFIAQHINKADDVAMAQLRQQSRLRRKQHRLELVALLDLFHGAQLAVIRRRRCCDGVASIRRQFLVERSNRSPYRHSSSIAVESNCRVAAER